MYNRLVDPSLVPGRFRSFPTTEVVKSTFLAVIFVQFSMDSRSTINLKRFVNCLAESPLS